ncbi:MAG: DEAD/DEAH box helicase family protein [Rubrivivax sp.]|nr:DEAD/DEAH box helicase family protein [Rubrivivax sp.]
MRPSPLFGIAPGTVARLRALFAGVPGIDRVWVFGSRARGLERPDSDIDLAIDAPGWSPAERAAFGARIEQLQLLYRLDYVLLSEALDAKFRSRIERDRVVFWEPVRRAADVEALGGISLKGFQTEALAALGRYLTALNRCRAQAETAMAALRAMEGMEDQARSLADFPSRAWAMLKETHGLPAAYAAQPYNSRWDGAGRAIPNLCLKVPTGGGKTLLAAASVAQVMQSYLGRSTGLVLWVVPNEAIYRQTLGALTHRDHPYRQMLNVAAAGRVKVLEKNSPLTRQDVASHLCVMVLMLQSAARASKETLKFFRDRGNVLGFLPREDDLQAHWNLVHAVPNLDVYMDRGKSAVEARAQMGSIIKSSLGNVMRLLRPVVVIDEGHHAYSDTALRTIDGFNPSFMLELSATPRLASPKGGGSNILCNVRGTDLDDAEMIKLPIQVDVRGWSEWQGCVAAALQQLDDLQHEATALHGETARYIRPIMLVQVERTGADTRDAGLIHAEDVKDYLLRLGLQERHIAIKTSERNDLKAPENIDLLSPRCEVRVIITKQALQEGWDCPFAYVLCALAAGRNLAAMTQLVGRILRLPHVAKTGRPALDACYVLCHDARTGDVVRAIKKSLEDEGMGDLGVTVRGGEADPGVPRPIQTLRRAPWQGMRIFVPKVTWVEADHSRRPLVYESDVLARVPWQDFSAEGLARQWAPDAARGGTGHLSIGLDVLSGAVPADLPAEGDAGRTLDRVRIVRALSDLAPNPWHAWTWLAAVEQRLLAAGYAESALAASTASLIERLRLDVQAERDRLAEVEFKALLDAGRIEFRLRADAADYELPQHYTIETTGSLQPLVRDSDGHPMEKSLLEPALRTADLNEFEVKVAGYLDQQQAVRWWHRNVAKAHVGLQGWKRGKVYPDFVFAMDTARDTRRLVLLETKGLHLAGEDTVYKQGLLSSLGAAFRDERWQRVGSLALEGGSAEELICDLVFDAAWQGTLAERCFSATGTKPA